MVEGKKGQPVYRRADDSKALAWWTDYNNMKHNRAVVDEAKGVGSYEKANQGNLLHALAALFLMNRLLMKFYATGDSRIPLHVVRRDFIYAYCDVFASYNAALFDCIRLMIRYEKSLMAWQVIVDEVEGKVIRDTLVMDYVHPAFTLLCDLPNVFKDRLVRGCVRLASLSKGDYSYLCDNRRSWFKAIKSVCRDTELGRRLCDLVENNLYQEDDAKHFLDIRGAGMHDLQSTLVSGTGVTLSPVDGAILQAYSPSFSLNKELKIIDRHRRRIQDAYALFGQYGDALYDEMLAPQRGTQ